MPATRSSKLSAFALNDLNRTFAAGQSRLGTFIAKTNPAGLGWHGFPLLSPKLGFVDTGGNPFITAGLFSTQLTSRPLPPNLLAQVTGSPDLVGYDWENTRACAEGLTTVAQLARHLFGRARLTHTTALNWLMSAAPKLGNSVTWVSLISPTHLSVTRSSTMGLTGAELQVLVDWLESPDFPAGLHTFRPQPHRRPGCRTLSPPGCEP